MDMWMVFEDADAHLPSVVPRTVIATGVPRPRLAATSFLHERGATVSSQPPAGVLDCASVVCALHAVTMRQSVLGACRDWLKSTSKLVYGAPFGVHCTEMTFRFGGTSTVSLG